MSTFLEQQARVLWQQAPFVRHGRCATCGCTHDEEGRPLMLAGVNGDSMVCVECWDIEHDGKHPNFRFKRTPRVAV